jgi:hypothetical protein
LVAASVIPPPSVTAPAAAAIHHQQQNVQIDAARDEGHPTPLHVLASVAMSHLGGEPLAVADASSSTVSPPMSITVKSPSTLPGDCPAQTVVAPLVPRGVPTLVPSGRGTTPKTTVKATGRYTSEFDVAPPDSSLLALFDAATLWLPAMNARERRCRTRTLDRSLCSQHPASLPANALARPPLVSDTAAGAALVGDGACDVGDMLCVQCNQQWDVLWSRDAAENGHPAFARFRVRHDCDCAHARVTYGGSSCCRYGLCLELQIIRVCHTDF